MPLSFIIPVILFLIAYGFAHYCQEIRPYTPKALFNRIKDGYSAVKAGKLSYIAFKEAVRNECSLIHQKDSAYMIRFKQNMMSMLNYDDFIHEAFSDTGLTMEKLFSAWGQYEPPVQVEENVESKQASPELKESLLKVEEKVSIPKVFATAQGKETMELMVKHGYCAPSTYEWIYDGENSSYIMALFADAIGRHLVFRRKRWKPFTSIWGEHNFPDLFAKASECPNVDYLVEKVKELFPDYMGPM